MNRAVKRALVSVITLAVLGLGYALASRWLSTRDVLEATFGERRLIEPAMLAVALGLRLFLVLAAPGWLLYAAARLAATIWTEKRRPPVSSPLE